MPMLPIVRSLVLLFVVYPCLVVAELAKELPGVAWEHRLGDDLWEHEYRAMAVSDKGDSIFVAVRARPAGHRDTPWSLMIWRVNQQTGELTPTALDPQLTLLSKSYADIEDLKVLGNGSVVLAAESSKGVPSIIKLEPNGKLSFAKEIADPTHSAEILKILPTADGGFVIVGHQSTDAVIEKVDPAGNKTWDKVIDRGKIESFFDGVTTSDGGVVVIGNSWTGDPFFIGPSAILVMKFDDKGNLQMEKSFPGRYASIAPSTQNSYAVVYDKSDTVQQSISVVGLSDELRELWNAPIFSSERGVARFRIASAPNGGFVVVGSRDLNLWVSRIDKMGKTMWVFSDSERSASNFDVTSSGESFFIAYPAISTFMAGGKRQLNTKVSLIKFIQK